MSTTARAGLVALLFVGMIASQLAYDNVITNYAIPSQPPSVGLVKAFDLGLHSAAASFLWLDTRTELPFLRQGPDHYLAALKLINDLDPRFNAPYVFTVLVLPTIDTFSGRIPAAITVAERGIAEADPTWQIPFYLAAIYQLELKDRGDAVRYFDIAATTPGIPDIIRRYAINYGIQPESLASTRAAWEIIYATSPDPTARDRAKQHIIHLDILQYLGDGVKSFNEKYHRYPDTVEEMVQKGVIPNIPTDPLGFNFKIYPGGVVGIAP